MNLEQILIEVGELRTPKGDPLMPNYIGWVNRAMRTMTERRNWSFMWDVDEVVMPAGATSVNLPATFKELGPEQSPVSYTSPLNGGYPIPCFVSTRARLQRMMVAPLPYSTQFPSGLPSFYMPYYWVFIERNGPGGTYTLNLMPQNVAQDDVNFSLSAYWHMEDLAGSNDSNALTNHGDLGDCLVNLTKAIAYKATDPADARAAACMDDFNTRWRLAATADARNIRAGVSPHW